MRVFSNFFEWSITKKVSVLFIVFVIMSFIVAFSVLFQKNFFFKNQNPPQGDTSIGDSFRIRNQSSELDALAGKVGNISPDQISKQIHDLDSIAADTKTPNQSVIEQNSELDTLAGTMR